jgi:hypothetical protein
MIADFIVHKMSGYVAGGASPTIAAHFTRGELSAIYRRQHHSRDNSGAWQMTPPPEKLDLITAMKKADAAIAEILNYCRKAGKVTETRAPESTEQPQRPGKKKTGLEGLENYLERHTA